MSFRPSTLLDAATLAAFVALAACARPTPAPVPVPGTPAPATVPEARPTPTQPAPVAVTPAPAPHGGPWTFTFTPGAYTYDISDVAQIATLPDTATWRPVPPVTGRATLDVGANGATRVVDPATPPTGTPCDSPAVAHASALALRATMLVPNVPQSSLVAGATWRDSTTSSGCRGPVLASATTRSTYTVIGDTAIGATRAVLLQRTDSITANGEGVLGQHRILLSGTGTGRADLLLDPGAGRLVSASTLQSMLLDVTTSGRTSHFLQRSSSRATLVDAGTAPPAAIPATP